MALQPFVGPWRLLQFRKIVYTDGRTPWMSDQSVARPLPTLRAIHTQNKRTHRNPCLEWDSNPRSQLSSERRQFMPQTTPPLWSAVIYFRDVNFVWNLKFWFLRMQAVLSTVVHLLREHGCVLVSYRRYIVRELPDSIFHVLPVFVLRWDFSSVRLATTKYDAPWLYSRLTLTGSSDFHVDLDEHIKAQ
jgi:hypothetical protein